MKESVRAAKAEMAHDRSVEALKALLGEDDEKVKELEALKGMRMSEPVRMALGQEILADIHERMLAEKQGGAGELPESGESNYPLEPLDEDVVRLLEQNGYDTTSKIRDASDEELLAIKGIGPAKLEEIRAAVPGAGS